MTSDREGIADLLERAAAEHDLAARHLRTAADHFRTGEVPRGCAHAHAARGHALEAAAALDENARIHAAKATP